MQEHKRLYNKMMLECYYAQKAEKNKCPLTFLAKLEGKKVNVRCSYINKPVNLLLLL